jgi:putative flippase GtrA
MVNVFMGKPERERASRVMRFLAVGGAVTALDLSLVWLFQFFLPPLWAISLAYISAVTCHFLLNKFWVFRCARDDYRRQLGQYGMNVALCWLVTVAVVRLCLATFTSNLLFAKVCALPPATALGFVIMRLLVFRPSPPAVQN